LPARRAPARVWLVALFLAAAVLAIFWWRSRAHGAFFPQFRRVTAPRFQKAIALATRGDADSRARITGIPSLPRPAGPPPSVAAYKSALASGATHPGAQALRADSDLFVELNLEAAKQQAHKEGISVDEVRELTFFSLVAMRTTQPHVVERVLGRKLSDDERAKLGGLVDKTDADIKSTIRAQVDQGETPEQRWAAIHTFEKDYTAEFNKMFGMSDQQFDQMLAPENPDSPESAPGVPMPPEAAGAMPTEADPTPEEKAAKVGPPPARPSVGR